MREYYKTKESVQEYIQLAKDVDSAQLIERLKTYLTPGSSLLEIGSGPGTDWNILNNDYEVIGSDFSEEFITHLKSTIPDGTFIQLDAITLETDSKFDGIYSNKVMQHLKTEELMASISKQTGLLEENGIICHSFWKGEGDEEFKGMYVNYHSENDIKELFAHSFEILELASYKEFEDNDSIVVIAKKL